MRYAVICISIAALFLIHGCSEQMAGPDEAGITAPSAAAKGGLPLSATVEFGRSGVGSDFPPAEHDRSFHAFDKIHPRTTVIAAGGTVTFLVAPMHYPAIFEPGTRPEDLDTNEVEQEEGCPIPVFEDEDGRIAEGPRTCPGTEVVEWSHTFAEPGRYLVICQILPHFVEARMYAWVEVK